MTFDGIENNNRQGSVLICLVYGFGRIVKRILGTDNGTDLAGKVNPGFRRQTEKGGVAIKTLFTETVSKRIEKIIAGM